MLHLQLLLDYSDFFLHYKLGIKCHPKILPGISEMLRIPDFCKILFLLQFILDYSEFLTRPTRHILTQQQSCKFKIQPGIPHIPDFFEMLLPLQFSLLILNIFNQRNKTHIMSPCNKAGNSKFHL